MHDLHDLSTEFQFLESTTEGLGQRLDRHRAFDSRFIAILRFQYATHHIHYIPNLSSHKLSRGDPLIRSFLSSYMLVLCHYRLGGISLILATSDLFARGMLAAKSSIGTRSQCWTELQLNVIGIY